jgi:hypothetical protein
MTLARAIAKTMTRAMAMAMTWEGEKGTEVEIERACGGGSLRIK